MVAPNQDKCINGDQLDWAILRGGSTSPNTPTKDDDTTKFNKYVFGIYLVVFAILGAALIFTIAISNTTLPASIITAMVTIAGFAVGINVDKSSK